MENIPLKLIVIEDSAFDARIIQSKLQLYGYAPEMTHVGSLIDFREAIHSQTQWDIIISDYCIPGLKMMDSLACLQETGLDIPFIIVSGGIGETEAVAAMKAGVNDYVLKDNLAKLGAVVERELRDARIRKAKKEAEAVLKESEYRYRTLWETSKDALLLVDANNTITLCSPAAETILGYSPDFLQGHSLSLLQPANDFQDLPLLSDCTAGGSIHIIEQTETQVLHRNGTRIDVETFAHKISLNGNDIAVVCIRDISEWKRIQAERLKNQEQLRIAQEIHKHLYPDHSPNFPGYDIAGISFPATEVGGDYFDFLPDENKTSIDIVIGDVSGHGIGPAILMSETRAYLRILSRNRENLAEILNQTNKVLADDLSDGRYVTLTILRLLSHPPALLYANAGHIPGYILDAAGEVKFQLKSTGIVLGRKADSSYKQSDFIALDTGDIILLLTDGLQEVFSPQEEMFGKKRIIKTVRQNLTKPAKEIVESLYKAGLDFSQSPGLDDDFTCIVIKVLDA